MNKMLKYMSATILGTIIASGAHSASMADGLRGHDEFSTLVAALEAAGLMGELENLEKTHTLFAPVNDAFAKISPNELDALLDPANKSELVDLLKYHLIDGALSTGDHLPAITTATSVSGQPIGIITGGVKVNNAEIIGHDIFTDNGIIHAVDSLIHLSK